MHSLSETFNWYTHSRVNSRCAEITEREYTLSRIQVRGDRGEEGRGCSVSAARCRLSYCARLNWMQKELQTSGRDHGALSNTISRIPTTIPPLLSPLPPSHTLTPSFALSLLSTTLLSPPPPLRVTLIFRPWYRVQITSLDRRACACAEPRGSERSGVCVCRAMERKSRVGPLAREKDEVKYRTGVREEWKKLCKKHTGRDRGTRRGGMLREDRGGGGGGARCNR